MISFIAKAYQWLIKSGIYLAPVVLLLLRLGFGWDLIVTARAHLGDVDTMVGRFVKWNVPYPRANVYISAYTELIGGGLLMLGLASRAISIPLIFNFVVAYLTAGHSEVVNFFQSPTDLIEDAAFPFLMTVLVIVSIGPGPISLDWVLSKTVFKKYAVNTK